MATLALDPAQPSLLDTLDAAPAVTAPAPAPDVPGHALAGERTLEDLVLGAWEELAVAHTASCPLCDGPLLPRFGAGARPVGSRCGSCASELT